MRILTRAIGATPTSDNKALARIHMLRGRHHALASDPEKALTDLERATQLAPDDAEPHLYLGIVLEQVGDLPGAIQALREACLERALRLTPDDVNLRIALADTYLDDERFLDAFSTVASHDESPSIQLKQAEVRFALDRTEDALQEHRIDEAIRVLAQAMSQSPPPKALKIVGELLSTIGEFRLSADVLSHVHKLRPRETGLDYAMAWTYSNLGREGAPACLAGRAATASRTRDGAYTTWAGSTRRSTT